MKRLRIGNRPTHTQADIQEIKKKAETQAYRRTTLKKCRNLTSGDATLTIRATG